MTSGSSTPTSIYTEAEMMAKMTLQADVGSGLKVKELNELLGPKGVKGRGPKPQKAKQVALVCTPDEVHAFRAEKETTALAAALAKAQKREPGQLTLPESVKRMRTRCAHDFVRVFPSGMRDSGERSDVCRLCNAERE